MRLDHALASSPFFLAELSFRNSIRTMSCPERYPDLDHPSRRTHDLRGFCLFAFALSRLVTAEIETSQATMRGGGRRYNSPYQGVDWSYRSVQGSGTAKTWSIISMQPEERGRGGWKASPGILRSGLLHVRLAGHVVGPNLC